MKPLIKDPRHCAKCSQFPCSRREHFNPTADLWATGCSAWTDKQGHTYSGFTYTWKYKWIQLREHHYGHPIRDFLTVVFWAIVFIGLLSLMIWSEFM